MKEKAVRVDGTYREEPYFRQHEILGYAPRISTNVSARKYYRDELIYDVTYSIDSSGLRVGSPISSNNTDTRSVLFFGGSFTFGEGVDDEETMPYQVGIITGGKYACYNFGFHGYGPHQMLAALENDSVENITNHCPKYAIYQGMTPHVARSAGLTSWDNQGPRYILNDGEELIFAGKMSDIHKEGTWRTNPLVSKWYWVALAQLRKSSILKRAFFEKWSISDKDIDLYVALVDRARALFESRYPDGEFHVIFWDVKLGKGQSKYDDKVLKRLYSKAIRVHLISKALPGYDNNVLQYVISVHDHHPNALTHSLIAKYVVENILGN